MKRFENQTAVITGGAEGLGFGIAERIAAEGGTVVLLDINETLVADATKRLISRGYQASSIPLDISNEADVRAAFKMVMERYGQLDILVNSAGIVGPTNTPITAYPVEEFDRIFAINLRGSFLVTKYAIALMEKKNYGRILLIASIAGKEGNPFMVGYSTTKAGVIGLVKAVAKEYAQKGITVNGIAPAVIRTAMNEKTDPEQLAYMASKIPMGRLGTVDEVTSLATWIVSPEASFNTGFIFDLSGGRATY